MASIRWCAALLCLVLAGCADDGDKCFDMVKGDLKDSQTATVVEWRSIPQPFMHLTQVTIRATNSYGAYGRVYGLCYVNSYRVTQDKNDVGLAGDWTTVK